MFNDSSNTSSSERSGEQLPPWQYASIEDDTDCLQRAWISNLRIFLNSRTLWRTILSLTGLLVIADLCRSQSAINSLWLPGIDRTADANPPTKIPHNTDWSQYAYCQYVTNEEYLCNSLMIFEALDRVGAKASKVMMYPEHWNLDDNNRTTELIRKAEYNYGVQLSPIKVQHFVGDATWADSFTKLLAFNQIQFRRVLSLDSDATVMKSLDELFLLPSSPVAMPRGYWLENTTLSSQIMLVEPSESEFNRILGAFANRTSEEFDMEIVNELYGKDCIVFPHRKYDLITGEFREIEHHKYLGSKEEEWDPDKAIEEAKFVHFSDWPIPKPWLPHSKELREAWQPACPDAEDGESCRDREIWLDLYADFAQRRERVCDIPSVGELE